MFNRSVIPNEFADLESHFRTGLESSDPNVQFIARLPLDRFSPDILMLTSAFKIEGEVGVYHETVEIDLTAEPATALACAQFAAERLGQGAKEILRGRTTRALNPPRYATLDKT